MTRHLLKLIWNRRRTNLLVMAEIFFSFLVLVGVTTVAVYYADNYRQPLGFSADRVWYVEVHTHTGHMDGDADTPPELLETARQLLRAVQASPEVEAVAGAFTSPYDNARWVSGNNRGLVYGVNGVTDDFRQVMGVEVQSGRWFSREDDAAADKPVVINERLARAAFGAEEAVGRVIPQDPPRDGKPRKALRVVGVIRDFREDGELGGLKSYMFERTRLDEARSRPPRILLVKLRPGTTVAFEEILVKRMQAVARDWSFEVTSLEQMRETSFRKTLGPLLAIGVIAAFLLLMVALGLTGVVWQNVTQRTKEIGLRRAKGATAANIQRQILGELAVMTTLALAVGALLVAHVPLFDFGPFAHRREFVPVAATVYLQGVAVSTLAIYFLVIVCGWYPGRLATRIQPAEALHYE